MNTRQAVGKYRSPTRWTAMLTITDVFITGGSSFLGHRVILVQRTCSQSTFLRSDV
ncbi:hypothetical protein ACVLD2_001392 [Paenibacillus sp. PvR052]